MGRFATPGHLASRAGPRTAWPCPGQDESGGKVRPGRTRPGDRWLRTALTEAAWAASRTKGTYLAARYQAIRGRRGHHKALGAVRHDLLVAYWHVVGDEVAYRERGPEAVTRQATPEQRARRLVRQLERLGHAVTLEPAAPAAA